jgi:hypothetical protein
MINYIPQELIFDPWEVILSITIQHIVLHSIRKYNFLKII